MSSSPKPLPGVSLLGHPALKQKLYVRKDVCPLGPRLILGSLTPPGTQWTLRKHLWNLQVLPYWYKPEILFFLTGWKIFKILSPKYPPVKLYLLKNMFL